MSEFKVKIQGLRITTNEEETMQRQMEAICDQILDHKNNICFQSGATAGIKQRLNNISNTINQECQTLRKMKETLNTVADKYEKTENTICKVSADNKVTAWEKLITQNWVSGLDKDSRKTVLDILTGMGDVGKIGSLPAEVLKILIDGDGLTAKDIGALIKGTGNSILGVFDAVKDYKDGALDKLWGLDKFETIVTDSQAGWLANVSKSFKDTLFDQFKVMEKGKFDGAKAAGWALSLVANGFSNYEEYQDGGISKGRAVAETISETLIDIGKGALITAGVAAGLAAIGVSAPAVVVAGAGVAISAAADFICKKVTGALTGEEKGLTETVSDFVLDTASDIGGKISDMASDIGKKVGNVFSSAKDAICSWGKNWRFGYT